MTYALDDGLDELFEDLEGDAVDALGFDGDPWDDDVDLAIVLDHDDRVRVPASGAERTTRQYPFNTICYIETRHPIYGWMVRGSGTLLAPQVVLTAGHVLKGASTLRVTPGAAYDASHAGLRSSGSPRSQLVPPARFRVPRSYEKTSPSDYGVILLPKPFTRPSRYMPVQARAASRSALRVSIAGFPCDRNFCTPNVLSNCPKPTPPCGPGTMWRHSEDILTVATADGMLRHEVDTMPGNSGSPIWLLGSGDTRILIGVHVGGATPAFNLGVRIRDGVIADIASWCAAARVTPPTMWRQRP